LFGDFIEEQAIEVNYPPIEEYEMMEKLSKEKSVLGVYVSGHPFEKFLPYFKDKTFNCSMLNDYLEDEEGVKQYNEIQDGQQVTMGGMIGAYKKLKTRSGSFMAFVTVEDLYGSIECVCFPKIYDRIRSFLEADRVVSLSGKISIETDKAPVIIVDKMWEFTLEEETNSPAENNVSAQPQAMQPIAKPIEKVQTKEDAKKTLWLNVTGMEKEDEDELLETLSYYAGETEVIFVRDGKKMRCTQKVSPNKALMAELMSFLPENCIKLL
jgi:DNA polymerase III alpha subunit